MRTAIERPQYYAVPALIPDLGISEVDTTTARIEIGCEEVPLLTSVRRL
jgi:hypothetical protein